MKKRVFVKNDISILVQKMGAEILSQQQRDQKQLLETQHNEINELHATLIQEFLTLLTVQVRPQEEIVAFQKEEEKRKQGTHWTL
jgi:homoserine trans-succinylase